MFYAHGASKKTKQRQKLEDHLNNVSMIASMLASKFGEENNARIAGILHDIGKYTYNFQQRLLGKHGPMDHSTIGAYHALLKKKIRAAICIYAHHIGLGVIGGKDGIYSPPADNISNIIKYMNPTERTKQHCFLEMTGTNDEVSTNMMAIDIASSINYDLDIRNNTPIIKCLEEMIAIKMLFSCLVDADYTDTGNHELGLESYEVHKIMDVISDVDNHINGLKTSNMQEVRNRLLAACITYNHSNNNIITVTAPTGSGKTCSILRLASRMAVEQNKDRIIVVMPYLSIIDQTHNLYSKIFSEYGPDFVIDSHSMCDYNDEMLKRMSENWNAPIIITTSNQFFETIFAHKPSRCRKLHNYVNSIVIFDEVQSLPEDLYMPTFAAISILSKPPYNVQFILSSATHPNYDGINQRLHKIGCSISTSEIVENKQDLFTLTDKIRDIDIVLPKINPDTGGLKSLSLQEVASSILKEEADKIVCIVNLKKHALELFDLLKDRVKVPIYHISTSMCPAHRLKVLGVIQSSGECIVVSTQCIECGVDLDFDVGYRCIAPYTSLVQANGRINRHGLKDKSRYVIFKIRQSEENEILYPGDFYNKGQLTPGIYHIGAEISEELLVNSLLDETPHFCVDQVNRYYELLFNRFNRSDEVIKQVKGFNFLNVSREYKIIKNDTISIVVPYDEEAKSLIMRLREHNFHKVLKQIRPYTISIYGNADKLNLLEKVFLFKNGEKIEVDGWYIYLGEYNHETGISVFNDESFII